MPPHLPRTEEVRSPPHLPRTEVRRRPPRASPRAKRWRSPLHLTSILTLTSPHLTSPHLTSPPPPSPPLPALPEISSMCTVLLARGPRRLRYLLPDPRRGSGMLEATCSVGSLGLFFMLKVNLVRRIGISAALRSLPWPFLVPIGPLRAMLLSRSTKPKLLRLAVPSVRGSVCGWGLLFREAGRFSTIDTEPRMEAGVRFL